MFSASVVTGATVELGVFMDQCLAVNLTMPARWFSLQENQPFLLHPCLSILAFSCICEAFLYHPNMGILEGLGSFKCNNLTWYPAWAENYTDIYINDIFSSQKLFLHLLIFEEKRLLFAYLYTLNYTNLTLSLNLFAALSVIGHAVCAL